MCTQLPFADDPTRCDRCGLELTGRRRRWCSQACQARHVWNHRWSRARSAAKRRDRHRCVTCGARERLEVNHIVPRVGGGYGWGCWNHLENLETLCHDCHVVVTNTQRATRRAALAVTP